MPPFFMGVTYGDARMGLARLFGLCAALLFASSVSAANIIDLGPSDYRNWGTGTNSHTGAGIRSSTGQTVRLPPLNGNLSVNRNAVIPYGSISNGLRQFTRINPASVAASAAVTGLFLAVDWAWDELNQEWMKYEYECPVGAICAIDGEYMVNRMCGNYPYAMTSVGEVRTVTAADWFWLGGIQYRPGTVVTLEVSSVAQGADPRFIDNCTRRYPEGNWPIQPGGNFPSLLGTIVSEPGVPELTPGPVDFSELEAYLPSADPNDVGRAGNDAMKRQGAPLPGFQDQTITGPSSVSGPETTSTSTDPVTGDTIVTTTNTTTNIQYGDTTITTTNTTTSTTYQNGQETSTTTTTETPGELPVSSGTASGEWPSFCSWATVVCDWLNWTQEPPPPEQDLPVPIDEDFFEYKEVSFGVKSCPPDYEINLSPFMDRVVGVSFQPLCDFAAIIYFMVMAASYIIAAYISIGVARSA